MKKKIYLGMLAMCVALTASACGTTEKTATDTTAKEQDAKGTDTKEAEGKGAEVGSTRLVSVDNVEKYITIGEYKGLTLDNAVDAITDEDVQAQIEEIKKRVDGSAPTVLFLRAASSNVKAKGSEGNVCGEMLADLGCVNIADSDAGLLDDLSMEAIIAADPQYIFVTVQGNDVDAAMQNVQDMLISNPAWNSLSAVQNGHYYVLDKRLFNLKPNAKWGEAYKQLADILYPEE